MFKNLDQLNNYHHKTINYTYIFHLIIEPVYST